MSQNGTSDRPMIGVDVGGTHTDVCVARSGGLARGKAFTTHDDYSRGILDAIGVAAGTIDLSLEDLLAETDTLVAGTTVVTNALTEMRGAKVGVIITRGFKDTFRFAGGFRQPVYDDHLQISPPDLVARNDIIEVDERITSTGVVAPLDEDQVRAAVRQLRDSGVEAIAVCFLWSFKDGSHEQRARELILEEWPEALVSLSSEVFPMMREHERFYSCVFNCFCQPAAHTLLDNLSDRLQEQRFSGELSLFAGVGGAISIPLARDFPILLLASGPAGGVTGAIHLAKAMGHSNIMVGDMGGTSFDTSLIESLSPVITARTSVNNLDTGISIVDITSVGAGGGSIAWIDDRGVPQVGPQSAGSMPGPACYGRGGTNATVTDAAVVAGMIDPANYLNGRVTLDAAASNHVVTEFAAGFGRSREEGAAAILDLTVANMASALRTVSIERGHDPRRFAMYAYGGTLPLFAARICERLGVNEIVIPGVSSVFSAYGVLAADFRRRYSRSVELVLAHDTSPDSLKDLREEMASTAYDEVKLGGLDPEACELSWEVSVRFLGQAFEITMPVEDIAHIDLGRLHEIFPEIYERNYGEGTAWTGSPVMLANLILNATVPRRDPEFTTPPAGDTDPKAALRGERDVLQPGGGYESVPVYDGFAFAAGMKVAGQAIIDEHDTTLYVPSGWTCERDQLSNYVLKGADR